MGLTVCQLEDGRVTDYGMALPLGSKTKVSEEWQYIGSGIIYSYDDQICTRRDIYHFYVTASKVSMYRHRQQLRRVYGSSWRNKL